MGSGEKFFQAVFQKLNRKLILNRVIGWGV